MTYLNLQPPFLLAFFLTSVSLTSLTACQKPPEPSNASNQQTAMQPSTSQTPALANADSSSGLVGCYTVSKTEPAQIKINLNNGNYSMQMREFNDPDKPWDKPEPLLPLPKEELKKYFDVDEKAIEQVIARPDRVFVLAQTRGSLLTLDPRFDSPYLGYIYKGSNTVYKIQCEK